MLMPIGWSTTVWISERMSLSVIIVGGGIAGLTAALDLHRLGLGLKLIIYEAHAYSGDVTPGAAIGLASNGLVSLSLINEGLVKKIYTLGYKAAVLVFETRDSDGSYLGNFPAGKERRYGKYGTIMIRRSDVQKILLADIKRLGIKIEYKKRAVETKELEDGVCVRFEDGSEDYADILIGADGVRSVIRSTVAPESKVIYSGLVVIGAFISKSCFDDSFREKHFPSSQPANKSKGAIMVFGPLGLFGLAPIDDKSADNDGSWIWWATIEADEKDLQI